MNNPNQPAQDEFVKTMTELIDRAAERMTPWQFRMACWKMGWLFRRIRMRLWWKGFVKPGKP